MPVTPAAHPGSCPYAASAVALALVATGLTWAGAATTSTASAAPPRMHGLLSRTNNTYAKLLECVTPRRRPRAPGGAPGHRRRQRRPVLPRQPGRRHQGYADSVDYVAGKLRRPATR